jgi:hypothetical protein
MEGSGTPLGRVAAWRTEIAAVAGAEEAGRIGRQVPVALRFALGRAQGVGALMARMAALRASHPGAHDFALFQVAALGGSEPFAEILPNFSLAANLVGFDDAVVSLAPGPRFPERPAAVVLAPDRSERLGSWVAGLMRRFEAGAPAAGQ